MHILSEKAEDVGPSNLSGGYRHYLGEAFADSFIHPLHLPIALRMQICCFTRTQAFAHTALSKLWP